MLPKGDPGSEAAFYMLSPPTHLNAACTHMEKVAGLQGCKSSKHYLCFHELSIPNKASSWLCGSCELTESLLLLEL